MTISTGVLTSKRVIIMSEITPQLKDRVLNLLCENCSFEQFASIESDQIKPVLETLETDSTNLHSILNYFQRLGLISDLNFRHNFISFVVRMEANDLKRNGGFVFHEMIVKKNIEQLILEIDVLKKQLGTNYLENTNKITAIASTIFNATATILGL